MANVLLALDAPCPATNTKPDVAPLEIIVVDHAHECGPAHLPLSGRARTLLERSNVVGRREVGVAQALERFAAILAETRLPDFSAEEWSVMRSAHQGPAGTDPRAMDHFLCDVEDSCRLDPLAAELGVDVEALLGRLQALTLAELAVVMDRVEGFWAGA